MLVAPRLMGRVGKAKVKTAQTQIQMLATALDLFHLDVGRYPTDEEGLKVLYSKPENLPVLERTLPGKPAPKDPWGRDYVYKCPGEHGPYDLFSLRGHRSSSAGKATTPTSPTGKADVIDWTSVKQG